MMSSSSPEGIGIRRRGATAAAAASSAAGSLRRRPGRPAAVALRAFGLPGRLGTQVARPVARRLPPASGAAVASSDRTALRRRDRPRAHRAPPRCAAARCAAAHRSCRVRHPACRRLCARCSPGVCAHRASRCVGAASRPRCASWRCRLRSRLKRCSPKSTSTSTSSEERGSRMSRALTARRHGRRRWHEVGDGMPARRHGAPMEAQPASASAQAQQHPGSSDRACATITAALRRVPARKLCSWSPMPVAGSALHARNEGQRHDGADNGRGAADIGAHRAHRPRLLEVPDGGLVLRFLFPPAKADAARRARRDAAGEAAAAIGAARAAIEPHHVAHAAGRDLLADAGLRQHGGHALGPRRHGARLEPGKQLVGERFVGMHIDGSVAVRRCGRRRSRGTRTPHPRLRSAAWPAPPPIRWR